MARIGRRILSAMQLWAEGKELIGAVQRYSHFDHDWRRSFDLLGVGWKPY